MGVAFCLLFSWWFVSGIFMMYWDYPAVSDADRLEHSEVLDAAKVKLSAEEAWAKMQADEPPRSILLTAHEGRAAYRFGIGRDQVIIYADTGKEPGIVTNNMRLKTAAAWTGQP